MYIENAARLGDAVLEVACQTGLACIAIKARYPWKIVVASDIHPTVCKMAKERIKYWGMNIPIIRCDAFHLPFRDAGFDVCFHEGLYEHYDELDVMKMETEHLRVAKHLVLDVPANPEIHKVDERGIIAGGYGYGDEHIRTFRRWMEILSAEGKVIHIFHRSPGHFGAVITRE